MGGKLRKYNPIILSGHTRPVVDLQYSPLVDGSFWFVTASKDGQPQLRLGTWLSHPLMTFSADSID